MFLAPPNASARSSTTLSGVLFADDFELDDPGITVLDDADDAPLQPEMPGELEPEQTPIDVELIRAEAASEARAELLRQIETERTMATARLCDKLVSCLSDGAGEVREIAEQAAESVARLLVGILAAALPAACARLGAGEAAQLAARILPSLNQAPQVTIRVGSEGATALAAVVAELDPDMRERVHVVQAEAMSPGDLRIAWQDGNVIRDSAALCREIAAVLEPLGLLASTSVGA